MNRFVYLDNNATTKISKRVRDKMLPYLDLQYGNPSSTYGFGKRVKEEITQARKTIADFVGAKPNQIVFTSGGSEGNCASINSAIKTYPNKKKIITTKVEHSSVIEYCNSLKQFGYKICYIDVDSNGNLNLQQLQREINKDVACVFTQYANNETGVIFNIPAIKDIINSKKTSLDFMWCLDCVQALGKVKLNLKNLGADICVFSGHKIYAPKGCGFMYIKDPASFVPLIAGHQENNLRGGTENVLGIVAMGEAIAEIAENFKDNIANLTELQSYLETELLKIDGISINAQKAKRLCNTTSVTLPANGNEVMLKLEQFGICVSTGSACNSVSADPSHVITAMRLTNPQNVVRISISSTTTKSMIDYFVENLKKCL